MASISGVPLTTGGITFADTGDAQTVTGTVLSTSTLTIPAGVTSSHASGATVEWPIQGDNTTTSPAGPGWTLNVNNGTSTLSLAGLNIAAQPPAAVSIIDTSGNEQVLSTNTGTTPVPLAPGTYTFLVTLPGANLATTGNTITFNSGGSNPAGLTGTIVATSPDTGWVTVTLPGTSSVPTYTASGDTLAANTIAGQTSISVSAVTGLAPGGTYSIGGSAPGSESFTIAATWNGVSTTIPLTAGLTVGHNSGTAIDTISYPQPAGVDYSVDVASGNGSLSTFPLFVTATNDFSFTCIGLSAACPATPGLVLGSGASNVPVFIGGASFTNTNPLDYIVTSTTPGVSFGAVTGFSGGFLETTVSIASGTAVNTNVQYTVKEITGHGTFSLPSSSQVNSNFLIGMTPTISAVTGIPSSLVPGETATFTVTGTFFDSSTQAVFLADTGNLAGTPDNGSRLGVDSDGVTVTGCTNTGSTLLTCTVHVSRGAANGAHDLLIENAEFGTAVFPNALNVSNATIGSISPTVYQSDGATATFTLSGLTGFNVGQNTSAFDAWVSTFNANGSLASSVHGVNTTVTYAGPNSVTVTVATSLLVRAPGGLLVVTLYENPGASGYGIEIDAPAILLGLPLQVTSPAGETPAGTSTGIGIASTCTNTLFAYPFNDTYCSGDDYSTAFQQGATVTAPAGSGLTVSGLTVLPGLITGTVAVAPGTPAGDVTLTVTNPDGGVAYTEFIVSPSPVITAVNGVPVITGPVSFLSGAKTTLTITGANFEAGAVVSDSVAADATFGTAAVNAAGNTITVPVTFITFTGATPLSTNLVVTNPDGGVGTVTGELVVNPQPDVTGGPYYVPTFTSNHELVLTGTGFEQGMTVASSNADYTVSIASVLPTSVTLLVSTDSAATSGTSTTLTFTNPDGGTTTATLNGGPPPVPGPMYSHIFGRPAHRGGKTTFVITGANLAGVSASVNNKKIHVSVSNNTATSVTVHITVAKTEKGKTAKLTLRNSFGKLVLAFSVKR